MVNYSVVVLFENILFPEAGSTSNVIIALPTLEEVIALVIAFIILVDVG